MIKILFSLAFFLVFLSCSQFKSGDKNISRIETSKNFIKNLENKDYKAIEKMLLLKPEDNEDREILYNKIDAASDYIKKYGKPADGLMKINYDNRGSYENSYTIISYPFPKSKIAIDSFDNIEIKLWFHNKLNGKKIDMFYIDTESSRKIKFEILK